MDNWNSEKALGDLLGGAAGEMALKFMGMAEISQ